nr:uncharacterized protein LOC129283671 [Lytechinus pictus]
MHESDDDIDEQPSTSTIGPKMPKSNNAPSHDKKREVPMSASGTQSSSNNIGAKRPKCDFDMADILLKRQNGEKLVKELEEGCLSYMSRKDIVKTLVSHLMTQYGDRPSKDVKVAMAKAIVSQFPMMNNKEGDAHLTWFSPSQVMENGKKKDSSGYLEVRLRNVRNRSTVKIGPMSSSTKPHRVLTSTAKLNLSKGGDVEDIDGKIKWLKHHTEPKQQVKTWMQETCTARASFIRENKGLPAKDLLERFPRLIDSDGMVDQDFRILFPKSADALFVKWPKYIDLILKYAEKQNFEQHLRCEEAKTDAEKCNLSFLVLPFLFPPGQIRGSKSSKSRYVRATVQEASASFIQRREIGTNIPQFLEENRHAQPFVLALGNRMLLPEQVFVIVEQCTIPCSDLLQGVDRCFKLIYILDVEFPWECQHVWDFLQKCMFKLGEGKGRDSSVPAVTLLRNFLENQM